MLRFVKGSSEVYSKEGQSQSDQSACQQTPGQNRTFYNQEQVKRGEMEIFWNKGNKITSRRFRRYVKQWTFFFTAIREVNAACCT